MKQYKAQDIRNIALAGHGGDGKTSLAEALLYMSGATDRLGSVTEGNTVCDFDPEETKRKIGERSKGRVHNEIAREKNRQAHLGKHYRTDEGKKRQSQRQSIPVVQYTQAGEYVATYNSAREAYQATGIAEQHISACRAGTRKSAGGYIWKYADQQEIS